MGYALITPPSGQSLPSALCADAVYGVPKFQFLNIVVQVPASITFAKGWHYNANGSMSGSVASTVQWPIDIKNADVLSAVIAKPIFSMTNNTPTFKTDLQLSSFNIGWATGMTVYFTVGQFYSGGSSYTAYAMISLNVTNNKWVASSNINIMINGPYGSTGSSQNAVTLNVESWRRPTTITLPIIYFF